MTLTAVLRKGLTIAALTTSLFAFAQNPQAKPSIAPPTPPPITPTSPSEAEIPVSNEIVIQDNNVIVPNPILQQVKSFAFDWTQHESIAVNKNKINPLETFLLQIKPDDKLSKEDQQALGVLLYRLGTYYTHVSRQADVAIAKMNQADVLFTNADDKAWNYNHLAYAYEQKYAATGDESDKKTALDYANRVISDIYHNAQNKPVAFAFCVKGLIQNDAKDYAQAESSFNYALRIYESIPGGKDEQYARAKNHLADIILDENQNDQQAVSMMEQLHHYWLANKDFKQNPYAARNLLSLGRAYLKMKKMDAARDNIKQAINIYGQIYGYNNSLLAKPYQLLAEVYAQMGDQKQALLYTQKAKSLTLTIENS